MFHVKLSFSRHCSTNKKNISITEIIIDLSHRDRATVWVATYKATLLKETSTPAHTTRSGLIAAKYIKKKNLYNYNASV